MSYESYTLLAFDDVGEAERLPSDSRHELLLSDEVGEVNPDWYSASDTQETSCSYDLIETSIVRL